MRILATLIVSVVASSLAQTPTSVTATGYLTDTMCGAKGATHSTSSGQASKHIDCPKRNVASGKAQYAIYDESSRRLYILDSSTAAARAQVESLLGQRVRITGTVSATPITRAGQSLVPDTEAAAAPTESGGMNPAPTAEGAASSAPTTTTPLRVVTRAKALDTSTPVAGVRTISSIEAAPISVR